MAPTTPIGLPPRVAEHLLAERDRLALQLAGQPRRNSGRYQPSTAPRAAPEAAGRLPVSSANRAGEFPRCAFSSTSAMRRSMRTRGRAGRLLLQAVKLLAAASTAPFTSAVSPWRHFKRSDSALQGFPRSERPAGHACRPKRRSIKHPRMAQLQPWLRARQQQEQASVRLRPSGVLSRRASIEREMVFVFRVARNRSMCLDTAILAQRSVSGKRSCLRSSQWGRACSKGGVDVDTL